MIAQDLLSDSVLRSAVESVGSCSKWEETAQQWISELSGTITIVRSTDQKQRSSRDFQKWLWEDNRVTAVGQGNISVDAALDNGSFREQVASMSVIPLPASFEERAKFLAKVYQGLSKQIEPFVRNIPRLKIFRVIAALYPEAMTTLADIGALAKLTAKMGGNRSIEIASRHAWVRQRLDDALGDTGPTPENLAERMALPWMLYVRFLQPQAADRTEEQIGIAETRLVSLPAVRRRRGLTGVKGVFPALLSALQVVREGMTKEELLDFLRTVAPDSKTSSLGVMINAYKSEFGAIQIEGDRYVLTERGESVLESQDATDLADWLLTRIFGVDNVIVRLRDLGPTSTSELTAFLRAAYPGWTSDYTPKAIIAWLRSAGVIQAEGTTQKLSELGHRWAERIHWTPESLPPDPPAIDAAVADNAATAGVPASDTSTETAIPNRSEIVATVERLGGNFPASMIERLHLGLWAKPIRHFAILTGLSGSGKTMLARLYGKAVIQGPPEK